MTQKEINEFLANTKVYVNGKSKEIQEKLFSLGYKWLSGDTYVGYTEKPFLFIDSVRSFSYQHNMVYFIEHEYREITAEQILSLELTEPSYRPFKNSEECWQEMQKHKPFGWLMNKKDKHYLILADIYHDSNFNGMIAIYNFADGTPFGIKEE